jgi:hypothetical protein
MFEQDWLRKSSCGGSLSFKPKPLTPGVVETRWYAMNCFFHGVLPLHIHVRFVCTELPTSAHFIGFIIKGPLLISQRLVAISIEIKIL